ncbi:MAG: hypothetical protein ABFS56_16155 [Pseudomonadota bacterium]
MNIILIHPYIVVRELDIHMSEPLGLVSLATYLIEERNTLMIFIKSFITITVPSITPKNLWSTT